MKLNNIKRALNLKQINNLGIYNFLKFNLISFLLFRNIRFKSNYFIISHKNIDILLQNNLADINTYLEIFGFEEYNALIEILKKDKFDNKLIDVVDLGANIGLFYKLLELNQIKLNTYVGVEPFEANFRQLYFNTYFNNRHLIHKAVWSHNKGVNFSQDTYNNANSVSDAGVLQVQSITLQEVLHILNGNSPLLIKIDIEGSEYEIIENSINEINQASYIFIEFHNTSKDFFNTSYIHKKLDKFKLDFISKDNNLMLVLGKNKLI